MNKHNLFLLKARVADTVAAMQTGSRRRILPVCTLIALMTANVGLVRAVRTRHAQAIELVVSRLTRQARVALSAKCCGKVIQRLLVHRKQLFYALKGCGKLCAWKAGFQRHRGVP